MKYLLILLLATIISGCLPTPMGRAKQDFACKDRGGVYVYVNSMNKAMCRDGTQVGNWGALVLTPEYYPEAKK